MNIGTRFAIAGAIISTAVAVTVGAVLVRQSTMDLQSNAKVDLSARLVAVAPVVASAPTASQLVDTLSANSTNNGIRVVRDGVESRGGSMPLRPPALTPSKIVTLHSNGQSWYADSARVDVAASVATSPVEVDMFYPLKDLNHRLTLIQRRVRLVLTISVVVASVLSWIVGTYVSAPLRRLSNAVAQREEKVPENQGVQEVDELGRTLNSLIDQLSVEHQQTIAALESARGFAYNAVHELRTPLTSIRTDLDVLRTHPELNADERSRLIANVATQNARLNSTLSALHDLSRGEFQTQSEMAEVDLADIAEQAVDAARAFNNDVHFELQTPDHVAIQGWAEGLRLAIDNLLTNAVRHGGPEVTVALKPRDRFVELVVQDNGPGVTDEQKATVFGRFVRGSTEAPGTGLGLALVKQQADLHGGDIRIEDAQPHGARFVWRLPTI